VGEEVGSALADPAVNLPQALTHWGERGEVLVLKGEDEAVAEEQAELMRLQLFRYAERSQHYEGMRVVVLHLGAAGQVEHILDGEWAQIECSTEGSDRLGVREPGDLDPQAAGLSAHRGHRLYVFDGAFGEQPLAEAPRHD